MKHHYLIKSIFIVVSIQQFQEIADVDYRHKRKVYKEFNTKNIGDNHDLYVQSDTLLVADVFETKQRLLKQMY